MALRHTSKIIFLPSHALSYILSHTVTPDNTYLERMYVSTCPRKDTTRVRVIISIPLPMPWLGITAHNIHYS